MKYEFSFYKETDFLEIERLVLASYQWEVPIWGLSRHEFSKGLHPAFTGHKNALEQTVAVYRYDGKIVACVINEGNYDDEVFFLFDTKKRATDCELLCEMIKFAKTYASAVKEDRRTKTVQLNVPKWNTTLQELVIKKGFRKEEWIEEQYQHSIPKEKIPIHLPVGYMIEDGNTIPDLYLSMVHRLSFGYGRDDEATDKGEQAFHDLRTMPHYKKELDLCVLDEQKRPVAFAIGWYDPVMSYCELEPLAVVWWERRKGIGTNLLNELINRVHKLYPMCKALSVYDQAFYEAYGREKVGEVLKYRWDLEVFISWEKESANQDYASQI